jgi:hypothetical protein
MFHSRRERKRNSDCIYIVRLTFAIAIITLYTGRANGSTDEDIGPNFCGNIDCSGQLLFPKRSVFHMVVGCEHESSYQHSVHKICEALNYCIERQRFLVVVNEGGSEQLTSSARKQTSESRCNRITRFLLFQNISYTHWRGGFTPDEKMLQTYDILRGIQDSRRVVYHTDVDEIPDHRQLRKGTCT